MKVLNVLLLVFFASSTSAIGSGNVMAIATNEASRSRQREALFQRSTW
jgi:hypothetical protein